MSQSIEVAVTPWFANEEFANKKDAHGGSAPRGIRNTTSWTAGCLCRQAEIAEALGCHSFWLPESHFGDSQSIPSPLTLLAAVAGRTRTLRLGSTSYLLTIRNPLQAAEEVAVLDQLSEGRVILGVGRGVQEAMLTAFDVPVQEKRKRFKTNLALMMAAWKGAAIAYDDGQPIYLAPHTVQKPHPPIWVAAFGPLALTQAGSLGMPYLASPMESLEVLVANYRQHQSAAFAAGCGQINTIPVMRSVFITASAARSRRLGLALLEAGQNHMQDETSDTNDWAIIGDRFFVRDKLSEYKDRLGLTHLIARGRLPDVSDAEQVSSHEALLAICSHI